MKNLSEISVNYDRGGELFELVSRLQDSFEKVCEAAKTVKTAQKAIDRITAQFKRERDASLKDHHDRVMREHTELRENAIHAYQVAVHDYTLVGVSMLAVTECDVKFAMSDWCFSFDADMHFVVDAEKLARKIEADLEC